MLLPIKNGPKQAILRLMLYSNSPEAPGVAAEDWVTPGGDVERRDAPRVGEV